MNQEKNFMDWNNPGTAFITGSSSGIGAAFAKELANQHFNLILLARRKEKLEKLASNLKENYGIEIKILVADLSKLDKIEQLYSYITELDNIDILINNAGFGTLGYFDSIQFGPQRDMIFVHNVAPVYFCRAALPIMIRRGRGVIINISSLAAIIPLPQNVIYSATKSFLKVFSETLNMELENTGVRVQCLCPGFTDTEFHEVGDFKDFNKTLISKRTWMSAEEVVKLSLKSVSENQVTFIPGASNQRLVKLWSKLSEEECKKRIEVFKISRKMEFNI